MSIIQGFSSCNTAKHLEDGQYLLKENQLKLEHKGRLPQKGEIKTELYKLYKQEPNGKFLALFPREWFYFMVDEPKDTSAFDRFIAKSLAEKPVVLDDSISLATAKQMTYLLNYKGFYDAKVEYELDGKSGRAIYTAIPGQQTTIDSVTYLCEDPVLLNKLHRISGTSHLKTGSGFDLSKYEKEKKRIAGWLRNNGYAQFHAYYFTNLEVDTFQNTRKANLYINIATPRKDSIHSTFYIGNIDVYLDYDPTYPIDSWRDTTIGVYNFKVKDKNFFIDPKTIERLVFVRPNELYDASKIATTKQQLAQLEIYRFIRIKETEKDNKIDLKIELTPGYKMEFTTTFDVNYANTSASTGQGNLLGLSLDPHFENRNLLGGGEVLSTDFSIGTEFDLSRNRNSVINSFEISAQSSLDLPRFLDYLGLWKQIGRIPLGGKVEKKRVRNTSFYQQLIRKSPTRIKLGYSYNKILNWNSYRILRASYGYEFKASPSKRYILNHIGVDFVNPRSEGALFDKVRADNPYLDRSFDRQVFLGFLLKDFSYIYNGKVNSRGESTYFRISTELGGAEVWGVNKIYNMLAAKPKVFQLGPNIEISQYAKVEVDFRFYKKITKGTDLAFRAHAGVVSPFGFSDDSPYLKQFYAGGSNSVRAWPIRGVGPGAHLDSLIFDPEVKNKLYQTGDIKLEFNLEYRFDLVSVMEGAFFLDVGNVWTSKFDQDRCGSQFVFEQREITCGDETIVQHPFYRQFAIATGMGWRFDFTYFLFRLDMALKLRNAYPAYYDENGVPQKYWIDLSTFQPKDIYFQIGLGYPF